MGLRSGSARTWRAAVSAAALALAACGGGTSHTIFSPQRLVVFGDETSVIVDTLGDHNGRKYLVNGLKSDNVTLDCTLDPAWTQYLAVSYGMVFDECNPAAATPRAFMRAAAGAKAADLQAQIDAAEQTLPNGPITSTDLVTVLLGVNDILEQYLTYPAQSADSINATLKARGATVGQQINRIAGLGGKVLAVTVPDIAHSPFALAEKAAHTDTDRSALIAQFVASFNTGMRLNLLNDGHMIGLVLGDELVEGIVINPPGYGIVNVDTAVCIVALPNCTTQTLINNDPTLNYGQTYLWADDHNIASGVQTQLGSAALARAQNNPF
jgi:hypothetical protein